MAFNKVISVNSVILLLSGYRYSWKYPIRSTFPIVFRLIGMAYHKIVPRKPGHQPLPGIVTIGLYLLLDTENLVIKISSNFPIVFRLIGKA